MSDGFRLPSQLTPHILSILWLILESGTKGKRKLNFWTILRICVRVYKAKPKVYIWEIFLGFVCFFKSLFKVKWNDVYNNLAITICSMRAVHGDATHCSPALAGPGSDSGQSSLSLFLISTSFASSLNIEWEIAGCWSPSEMPYNFFHHLFS